jgi:hypothetical protein
MGLIIIQGAVAQAINILCHLLRVIEAKSKRTEKCTRGIDLLTHKITSIKVHFQS